MFSTDLADKGYRVPSDEDSPALRLRLLREFAQRVRWSALTLALFATLFSVNLRPGVRVVALSMSGLLAALGTLRTLLARRVITGQDAQRDGGRLIQVAGTLSLTFGVFVAYALWQVRGQVIPESLMVISVAGVSSISASMFAPFPRMNRLNAYAQLLPLYVWTVFALPRYGWLLLALGAIHAVGIAQTIRMNGAHIRQMFIARLTLEVQSEDLRQARDAADKAASAKMRFLANMSHEIRTPLNGIIGLAEVLNHLSLTEEQHVVLDDIGHSGQHLLSIVNDILDMAKVTSGKVSLDRVPFDLPSLIRDLASPAAALAETRQLRFRSEEHTSVFRSILDMAKVTSGKVSLDRVPFDLPSLIRDLASPAAALAETRQLRFLLEVPPDLPGQVQGDPLRIRQVVSNLLGNAVKFTPSGEVRLAVQVSRPGWIRFGVSDTGIGLSPEQKASLFQEFHQVDSSPTRKFGGSGLGLAISHRLAGLMGGRLWVESRLNEGSTFCFDLPLATTGPDRKST